MLDPRVVGIPESVFRVGRSSDPLQYSRIRPEDADLPRSGNRFDVPGAGVLYAATKLIACFGETLARFRPSPAIRAVLGESDEHFVVVGGVPQDWRLQRTIAEIEVDVPPQFLDVDSPQTHEYLSHILAPELELLGYKDPLDLSDIRGRDRKLSRRIALHAFNAQTDEDEFVYAGIRYGSRISPDWECWAIFEGLELNLRRTRSIELDNPDMQTVAEMWDLRVF